VNVSPCERQPGFLARMTPAARALLLLTVGVFLLQLVIDSRTGDLFTSLFGLGCDSFKRGYAWQSVTYMFLHGGPWHLFLNMLALTVFGTELERVIGSWRFIALYLVCGILGGIGWILLSCNGLGVCIGASGSVFGVIGAFAAIFPRRQITLLVFFVLPVTLRAGMLAVVLAVTTVASLMLGDGNVAHAAHLAGGVAGYAYGLRFMRRGRGQQRTRTVIPFPGGHVACCPSFPFSFAYP
jgi:membrane associated rhomboid family serine protease